MPITTLNTLAPNVTKLLGNRTDVAALAVQQLADAITEFSDNYPFEELRETGPLVQFTPFVNTYNPNFFLATPIGGVQHTLSKVVSWFFYLQPPTTFSPSSTNSASNPGYNIVFKDVENLEVLLNTLTLPQFWTWMGANIFVAATPNQAYYTYMRYQFLHPFSYPAVGTDPVLIPYKWYDIAQYAAAERIALQLRLQDVAQRYHTTIFGDPEFERSSGGRGQPGLIARRTSQTQKNQSRTTRSIRVVRSQY
jgi:hypothetical protein